MIKINKPSQAPAILLSKGVSKAAEHCAAYALHPADYRKRKDPLTFTFSSAIYGHATVKNALIEAQFTKCCFCESQIGNDGDVEHFRPKAASCQQPATALIRPGYYWLAYDWDNLLLCCTACNTRQKRNFFPLLNPRQRARSHQNDYKLEEPIFIQPAKEDPQKFISFREEIPYGIRGNKRGKLTIDLFGLNREIMNERRRSLLKQIKSMQYIVEQENRQPQTTEWAKIVADAKTFLAEAKEDSGLFAGMVRAYNKQHSL